MSRSNNQVASTTPDDGVESLGSVRRSQLVSSFGIGAIVDLEKGSFMPMGLEDWEGVTRLPSLHIDEPRLRTILGVDHFRLGPTREEIPGTNQVRRRSAAPAIRFPRWHECPQCHRIGTQGRPFDTTTDGTGLQCIAHGRPVRTSPVRFVLACRRGHINDFPWVWWAHRDNTEGVCDSPILRLGSYGRSASLSDLFVQCDACSTGKKPVRKSLGEAFRATTLKGFSCSGARPWLDDREEDCEEEVRALQRGASNIHFPVVCSSLSIPPASEAIYQILEELKDFIDAVPESALPGFFKEYEKKFNLSPGQLLAAYRQWKHVESSNPSPTDQTARREEYEALSQNVEEPMMSGVVPQFRNRTLTPPTHLDHWFDLVGAASRLREVRVLAGFSRIQPYPVSAEGVKGAITKGAISPLSKASRNWLPAAEIRGEGIFLRFRTETVDQWIDDNPNLVERTSILETQSKLMADERGYSRDYSITPRLLLVHSFSHALICQISVECGYSASSLRERLFVSETDNELTAMNGVLIYTGSPDSEGSLGGLVSLADPQFLGSIIERTLESARWCGSDPVCLETDPNLSGEHISGAACHCCLLLPETACEKFNRELDRAVLVGDSENSFAGYFST